MVSGKLRPPLPLDFDFDPQTQTPLTMKKKLMAMLIAGLGAIPAFAQASTPYVSANLGLGFASNSDYTPTGQTTIADALSFKTGIPLGVAVGMTTDYGRIEAALGYQRNSVAASKYFEPASDDHVTTYSYMANAYYDYEPGKSSVTPYIMGGLGGATIKPNGNPYDGKSSTVFVWQLGAGIGIKAADRLVLDVGYRYVKPGSITVTGSLNNGNYTIGGNNILLGLRYSL